MDRTPIPSPPRPVRLFRNGANQAVRIPREFELPGNEALMRKEGNTLVIELAPAVHPRGSPQAFLQLLGQLAQMGPCNDEFPDVDKGLIPPDDIVL